MWLYVPMVTPTATSACAPEAAASISASSWQCRLLEQSCWWRGKPRPSRLWSRQWRRDFWLQRLCGRMSDPSTAAACVDGVVGGIPCQPHSVAGRRLGRDDPRDLWSAARRIIVQSGAWWVLIENVRGMLSSGGAERVWRDLGRLGFEREVGLFSAAEVGASHERERLFVLGVADRHREHDDGCWSAGPGGRPQSADGSARGGGMADPDGAGLSIGLVFGGDAGAEQPPAVGIRRDDLVDAARLGRREGRAGAELRSGRDAVGGPDRAVGDADRQGQSQPRRDLAEGWGWSGDASLAAARDDFGLSPPGPGDRDGWFGVLEHRPDLAPAIEPLVRRVADGLAGGLDLARAREIDGFRTDALRLLGNGVHPLVAAHALRTLCARLAARGCAGAAFLVDLMGAAS